MNSRYNLHVDIYCNKQWTCNINAFRICSAISLTFFLSDHFVLHVHLMQWRKQKKKQQRTRIWASPSSVACFCLSRHWKFGSVIFTIGWAARGIKLYIFSRSKVKAFGREPSAVLSIKSLLLTSVNYVHEVHWSLRRMMKEALNSDI